MQYITPTNRLQLSFTSLDNFISSNNPIRVIDAFVDKIELQKIGILPTSKNAEQGGRPGFQPQVLLKIYLYGYYNRIRSSRRLEKECERNIELHWLTGQLVPNYHTIADFRKQHSQALQNLFKLYVLFLKENGMLGQKIIGIDGTKIRAVNSKQNNYNASKIERILKNTENQVVDYLQQLEEADKAEANMAKQSKLPHPKKEDIQKKLQQLKERKIYYDALRQKVALSEDGQVSTTDTDSRSIIVQKTNAEVSYNIQTATDDKHCLVVHVDAINTNDANALATIAKAAQAVLNKEDLIVLADKGYHNGREIHECSKAGMKTLVANKDTPQSNEYIDKDYLVNNFTYNKTNDTYTCPKGATLFTLGGWYTKSIKGEPYYQFKKYRTKACYSCPVKHLCTTQKAGRIIYRNEHQDAVDLNNKRVSSFKELYRKRQTIVEHPFGTIKRGWGYSYTLLKGLKKVNGEMGLIFLTYNIRRSVSILGVPNLIARINDWKIA
jgi:transposase